jgi:hypothetical protein
MVTYYANAGWDFDIVSLNIPDSAKITLIAAMSHTVGPEEDGQGQQVGPYIHKYPSTAWLVKRRGMTPQTIRRHTRQIRKALGGLW